jgi:polyhydroxyalkanoate synthesis repressor PhaR
MPVIKRYSNRKLYDTESKRYVTLEDVAEFIRRGDDVRVVDHVSGEDLTSTTLLQVIFEEEKKIGGLLPQVALTRLIRAGGEAVSSLRSRLAGIDPFQVVDEEIRRRAREQVKAGRLAEDEAGRIVELLTRKPPQADVIHIPVQGEEGLAPPEARAADAVPPDPLSEPADPREVADLLRQIETLERELAALQAGARS